jgi:hypothetical protein
MFKKFIAFIAAISLYTSFLHAQTISGVLKDALLDKPIQGATVTIVELKKSYKTDSFGAYATEKIEEGTYTVQATAPQYLKLSKRIILSSKHEVGVSDMKLDLNLYNISSNAGATKGNMTVNYYFPGHNNVLIIISNKDGRKVRRAFDKSRTGGKRRFSWDGKDDQGRHVPPGTYTCQISSGTMVMNRQITWEGTKKD